MAAQAKVVIPYDRAFWREAGQSGNAFVTHEQAVIGEIFDACDGQSRQRRPGRVSRIVAGVARGFQRWPADADGQPNGAGVRLRARAGRAALSGLGDRALYLQRARPNLAPRRTRRDRQSDAAPGAMGRKIASGGIGNRMPAAPATSKARWRRRGESICRSTAAGRRRNRDCPDGVAPATASASINASEPRPLFPVGRGPAGSGVRRLPPAPQSQPRRPATRAAHAARGSRNRWKRLFDKALAVLDGLPFDISAVAVERGRSPLTPGVQQPFGALMQSVLDDVKAFNRTSCALSNFPDEHHLSREYLAGDPARHRRRMAGILARGQPAAGGQGQCPRSPPASIRINGRVVMNEER